MPFLALALFDYLVILEIIIIIIYRFLERHILKALWRFTILKINNLTNQKTIKSLSKKKGLSVLSVLELRQLQILSIFFLVAFLLL